MDPRSTLLYPQNELNTLSQSNGIERTAGITEPRSRGLTVHFQEQNWNDRTDSPPRNDLQTASESLFVAAAENLLCISTGADDSMGWSPKGVDHSHLSLSISPALSSDSSDLYHQLSNESTPLSLQSESTSSNTRSTPTGSTPLSFPRISPQSSTPDPTISPLDNTLSSPFSPSPSSNERFCCTPCSRSFQTKQKLEYVTPCQNFKSITNPDPPQPSFTSQSSQA